MSSFDPPLPPPPAPPPEPPPSFAPPTFSPPPRPAELPPPLPRRKSRARWIVPLALLFLFVAFCGGLALIFLGALAAGGTEGVSQGSLLQVRLRGGLRESPDPVGALLPALAGPPSLYELRKAILRAADDSNISGLELDVQGAGMGWAEGQELVATIDRFRKSGKPVHAFLGGEFVSEIDYAIALAGDRVWVAPMTSFAVNGLQAEFELWRGTLDKLHVEPQFFMRREYKSAGEVWTRTTLSDAAREATTAVLTDIWESFLADVAKRRKLDIEQLRANADLGILTASEAAAAKWVDAVGHPDDLHRELVAAAKAPRYRPVSVRRYLRHTTSQDLFSGKPRLALVFGEGVIVSSSDGGPFDESFHGPAVADAIRNAADDAAVKGILFRVNSPGGSAVGSDYVWRAVEYARNEKKKPVVVSMSSLAGSGGYWVAMNADAIVAQPSTITGSIGVVFGKWNVLGLYNMAGANVDTVSVGANAGILSLVSSFDDAQRARIDAWMDNVYGEFKNKVATGRKLDPVKVEEIARGRIWSGTDARELGLVDQLGGYDEALALLREKAGLARDAAVDLTIYPRQKTLFEALMSEDEPLLETETLRTLIEPERALRRALAELSEPGVRLLTPPIKLR